MNDLDKLVARTYAIEQMVVATMAALRLGNDGEKRLALIRESFEGLCGIFPLTANDPQTAKAMKDQMRAYGIAMLDQIQVAPEDDDLPHQE